MQQVKKVRQQKIQAILEISGGGGGGIIYQKTTVTFSPNNDLAIQNFDFELIIGYFELSKSQFKAFNLPQNIFQNKKYKFQVIKVKILTCKSPLSKC